MPSEFYYAQPGYALRAGGVANESFSTPYLPSPVRKGSCPSEIRYGALVERQLIGRGRVKFYGHAPSARPHI
jgi:hypothetical protein